MRAYVRETKRKNKALQERNAELEERLEKDEAEWLKHDARRLDEQGQLFQKLEMIKKEKRRCERCDCTETRRKY